MSFCATAIVAAKNAVATPMIAIRASTSVASASTGLTRTMR